ncbi:MAG: hypothetical protein A3G93_06285 [Nitrospinae bacterium RIFCSPLOWO2_12_FULL_45_22]|nr:MAG: hypothetical protein A3G93_06285 [Nitrospinae bacterium RIFCSPLOWO2_12_FULL_45_22]
MVITAENFFQYSKCPRWLYLELHGDSRQKTSPSDFLLRLKKDSLYFEQQVLKTIPCCVPQYEPGNYYQGMEKTLALMQQGVDWIAHGVLFTNNFLGIPDLLEKVPGNSLFGTYHYRPVEIKSGRTRRKIYLLQTIFYVHILEIIQGRLPDHMGLILSDRRQRLIPVRENYPYFQQVLQEIEAIFQGQEVSPFISSACQNCPWERTCVAEAWEREDISLIPGLSRQAKERLKNQGIIRISQLAHLSTRALRWFQQGSRGLSKRIKLQAQALASSQTIQMKRFFLPEKKVEIFLDIESEYQRGIIYLIGVLVCQDGQEEYRCFVAKDPIEECRIWQEFLAFMAQWEDDFIVYHYHTYEPMVLKKLQVKYGGEEDLLQHILGNMADIHKFIKDHLVIPTRSYSLKEIAKWLGFSWSNHKANAHQSMLWYSLWLETAQQQYLDWAIEYNRDDCLATKVVKEWLINKVS